METKSCLDPSAITVVVFIVISSYAVLSESEYIPQKTPLSKEQICQQFSSAQEGLNEFYTPMFPEKYPNHTECVLTLSADYGYLIRLDFRDYFDLESEVDCKNDYLEIRDGPYGYSELMGKFCGSKFPPLMTSKDRHLWLKFSSDDSLEYRGFRAVYDYVKNTQIDRPEINQCSFEMSGHQGKISSSDIPKERIDYALKYSVSIDCTWYIEVDPGQRIYLFFKTFKLAEPNGCNVNYITIFQGKRDLGAMLQNYCGSLADSVETKDNKMYFRFFAVASALKTEFVAWFTAYRNRTASGNSNGKCYSYEYDCDDATCIHPSLECNEVENCKHQSDEEDCGEDDSNKFDIFSTHIISVLTLGCGLLAGMCFAMFYNCIKKLIRDGRQIHENIRRSREQLEERRSTSMGSSPQLLQRSQIVDVEAYEQGKKNGHTCIQDEDEEGTEEEEEEETDDEEEDDSCIEMRDCECQTRDSIASQQRDSGPNGTPPPPPPPTRRPPIPLNSPPLTVPTPPPPPGYYDRHRHPPHGDIYGASTTYNPRQTLPSSDHYEVDDSSSDPYKPQHRSEAVIQMRDRPSRSSSKSEKSTPDVLVTH